MLARLPQQGKIMVFMWIFSLSTRQGQLQKNFLTVLRAGFCFLFSPFCLIFIVKKHGMIQLLVNPKKTLDILGFSRRMFAYPGYNFCLAQVYKDNCLSLISFFYKKLCHLASNIFSTSARSPF